MRIYSHGIIAYLIYIKASAREKKLAILGGITPDIILGMGFIFDFLSMLLPLSIFRSIHDLFHQSALQGVTQILHSFTLVVPILILSYYFFKKALPFLIGMFAHIVLDLLTHANSTYNHFFPIQAAHFVSPISYTSLWFTVFEHILIIGFIYWIIYKKK